MNDMAMRTEQTGEVMVETIALQSELLGREVCIDFYHPASSDLSSVFSLLLINDGQDLVKMGFEHIFSSLNKQRRLKPMIVVAIHCGEDRMSEYGMSVGPDYSGRGSKASAYEQFVITELLPFIHSRFYNYTFEETAFAGFSLGALSAFDISWNNPSVFSKTGVFSGSLWWRSVNKDDKDYDQHTHRMMHKQVREGEKRENMKFFFQCGELDEAEDRNRNGVIDSIDDTVDLMRELLKKGYYEGPDMYYLQLADGKHDTASWAKAIPSFLKWGFSNQNLYTG